MSASGQELPCLVVATCPESGHDSAAHMPPLYYDAGAAAYDRLTGRWSVMFADAALNAVVVSPANTILDLAAGTGDGALLAIQRVDPSGTVIGVDLSVPMLSVAQSKASSRPVIFVASDAQRLPFFDPLVRYTTRKSAAERKPGSIGLGLYIVREIVVAKGGTVTVTSTAEEGTTFTVRIPRLLPVKGDNRADVRGPLPV